MTAIANRVLILGGVFGVAFYCLGVDARATGHRDATILVNVTSGADSIADRAGAIAGTVAIQPTGDPIPEVVLVVFDSSGAMRGGTKTDGSGAYTFAGLAPDVYRVQVSYAPGYTREAYPDIACRLPCAATAGALITVAAEETTTSIDFSLSPLEPPAVAYVGYETGGPSLRVIDSRIHQEVASLRLAPNGVFLGGVAVSPDGRTVYVAGRHSPTVFVVDAEKLEVTSAIPVGAYPLRLALTPNGTKLYVLHETNAPGQAAMLTVIDAVALAVTATFAAEGNGLAVVPDGTRVVVFGGGPTQPNDPTLKIIDTATDTVTNTVTLCRTVDCAGDVYRVRNVVFDGQGRAYVYGNDGLQVLDSETFDVIDRRPALASGDFATLQVSRDAQLLFIRGRLDGESIGVYSTASFELLESIPSNVGRFLITPDDRFLYAGIVRDISARANVGVKDAPDEFSPVPRQGVYPSAVSATYGLPVVARAQLLRNGLPVSAKTVSFTIGGEPAGVGLTDSDGVAFLSGVDLGGRSVGTYADLIVASFAGDGDAPPSTRSIRVTITPAEVSLAWSTPAPLRAGTPLGADQLNATANVPGTFAYTPSAGTLPPTGILVVRATFAPTDPLNYRTPDIIFQQVTVYFDSDTSAIRFDQSIDFSPGVSGGRDAAFDLTTNTAYFVPFHGGLVQIVSGQTDTVTGNLVLENGGVTYQPLGVAVDPSNRRIYVSTATELWVFDRDTRALIERVTVPARRLAVDSHTGVVYAVSPSPSMLRIFDPLLPPGDPRRFTSVSLGGCPDALAFNPTSRLLYVAGACDGVQVVEADPARLAYHTVIAGFPGVGPVAVNRLSNHIYVSKAPDGSASPSVPVPIQVLQGKREAADFHEVLSEIALTHQDPQGGFMMAHSLSVDPGRGLLYAFVGSWPDYMEGLPTVTAIDLATNAVVSAWPAMFAGGTPFGGVLVNPATGRLYSYGNFPSLGVLVDPLPTFETVTAGPGVGTATVDVGTTSLTFTDVTSAGETSVAPMNPATVDLELPGQYSISGAAGYEVTTTAGFDGPITICFDMSSVGDPSAFSALRVLHGENGAWVDRTVSSDFETGQICASVSSLSPFAVASLNVNYQVGLLFDNSKAFKSGSTIPLKLKLLDENGANVSSELVKVTAMRLTRVSTGAAEATQDSGNANPDGNFRYSSSLVGYIFNLSTKNLEGGTYALTFRASGQAALQTLQFQIR